MLSAPIQLTYWYLYSYIAYLVTLPFLRSIAQKLGTKQFIYLFVLAFIGWDIFKLLALTLGISGINFGFFVGSSTVLCPLVGYYLDIHSEEFVKKWMYPVMGAAMFVCLAIAAQMTIWDHSVTGAWEERYIGLFSLITTTVVFLFVKKSILVLEARKEIKMPVVHLIQFMSGSTFGIYLLEFVFKKCTRPVYDALVAPPCHAENFRMWNLADSDDAIW